MPVRWGLGNARPMLQEPPKPKRVSKLSIRQLLPNLRSPNNGTQTSERRHERVSIRYPRGRAPVLHLRLSEFDVDPPTKPLRSPTYSTTSLRTYLISQTPPTGSPVEPVPAEHLGLRDPRHRNTPSDVPISPLTPNSPWTITGLIPRVSSSSDGTAGPRSPTQARDKNIHHPTHTREDTMSSTMSNIRVEVMTLSGSPPDPGFVLPIPSRSRIRQNFDMSPDDLRLSHDSMYLTRTAASDFHSCAQNLTLIWDNLHRNRYMPRIR
jgi:hypothetical protein